MSYLLFKRGNDLGGWIVFLIAAFVYGMTIEPTASFWDCPEFISCAEKLQVGHPPGAPFYMLVGNLFTQFASDASQVSRMVNFLNALLSAGCILFLFWSITRLVRSILTDDTRKLSTTDVIIILGAGFVGALAYTFSDTFWFSAVEGEVYAFSSFLTALVFWMILRWQDRRFNIRRPLDYPDSLYHRTFHRSTSAQSALYSCYCIGVLLPEIPSCITQGSDRNGCSVRSSYCIDSLCLYTRNG